MRLFLIVCFSWAVFLPTSEAIGPEKIFTEESCQEIKCTTSVINSSDGLNNGSIQINFPDNRSLFKVSVISGDGKKDIDDSKSKIDSLKKGSYLVVVTGKKAESKFCPQYFELVIK